MVTTIIAHVRNGVITPDEPIKLLEGAEVRLQVETQTAVDDRRRLHVIDILERYAPPGVFKTSSEVDAYLESERNTWD